MLVIAAFWLVLVLPGYVLLRRLRCRWLAYGLPSTLTLSYLASFALLSPISIAGYAFHWPLWVLSGATLAAVLAAVACLFFDRRMWIAARRLRPRWWSVLGTL